MTAAPMVEAPPIYATDAGGAAAAAVPPLEIQAPAEIFIHPDAAAATAAAAQLHETHKILHIVSDAGTAGQRATDVFKPADPLALYLASLRRYEPLAEGTLVEILPQYRSLELGIYAVYPTRKHVSAKVRALIDFLAQQFEGRGPAW